MKHKIKDCGNSTIAVIIEISPDSFGTYSFTFPEIAEQLGVCCENCEYFNKELRYCEINHLSDDETFYCSDFKREEF